MNGLADEGLLEYCLDAINEAAAGDRVCLYTPSVLREAAEALHGIESTLGQYGIEDAFTRSLGSLAGRLLWAFRERFAHENYLIDEDVDPVALLSTVVQFVPDHLGRSLTPLEGPTLVPDGRGNVAYMILPRQPESADRGQDGDAPLVVTLGQPDLTALGVAMSSGSGGWGREYRAGPWGWYLSDRTPDRCFAGIGRTKIVAQAVSNETACEVADVIAHILTGQLDLTR